MKKKLKDIFFGWTFFSSKQWPGRICELQVTFQRRSLLNQYHMPYIYNICAICIYIYIIYIILYFIILYYIPYVYIHSIYFTQDDTHVWTIMILSHMSIHNLFFLATCIKISYDSQTETSPAWCHDRSCAGDGLNAAWGGKTRWLDGCGG
jgi:hypothetical protein